MKKKRILLSIGIIITLTSCQKADFSNPEDVLKNYKILSSENKNDVLYEDFLSAKSKEFVTKDEFVKERQLPDSIINFSKLIERNITGYSLDIDNPSLRRFKVIEKFIEKSDTAYYQNYYTLINENGKWKIIWTGTLKSFAIEKYEKGNYSEARKTFEKIIEINPFDGGIYSQLAWCYYRDKALTENERESGMLNNVKYALALEEDNPEHYNTLSAYYNSVGNTDLQIQTLERGIKYCKRKNALKGFYSNLAVAYTTINDYEKAEYFIKKCIALKDNSTFLWFRYGIIRQMQNKNLEAIEYYEKALKGRKMENSSQGALYYCYASCCFNEKRCEIAKEYIAKALDIQPNDPVYLSINKIISNCN